MLLTSSNVVYSTDTIDRSLGTAQNHPGHAIQKALQAYVLHEGYENKTPQVCNRLLSMYKTPHMSEDSARSLGIVHAP